MATAPDNLDPKEATEARLCAYLEGELPPVEQAEIEKYLQTNPQHRQLLTQLARTRELVRALPRESAPVEIAEAFRGQLERSMLLGETGAGADMRINRWPQIALVAAMVVLAVGLAAVVYFVLPSQGPAQYSITTPSAPVALPATGDGMMPAVRAPGEAPPAGAPASVTLHETELKKEFPERMRMTKEGGPVPPTDTVNVTDEAGKVAGNGVAVAPPAAPDLSATAGPLAAADDAKAKGGIAVDRNYKWSRAGGGKAGEELARAPSFTRADLQSFEATLPPQLDTKALNERLAQSNETIRKLSAAPGNTLYLVICTNDPGAAASQVRQYFDTNRIAYSPLLTDGAVTGSISRSAIASGALALSPPAVGVEPRPLSKSAARDEGAGNVASKSIANQQELQQMKQYVPKSELPVLKDAAPDAAVQSAQSAKSDASDRPRELADTRRRAQAGQSQDQLGGAPAANTQNTENAPNTQASETAGNVANRSARGNFDANYVPNSQAQNLYNGQAAVQESPTLQRQLGQQLPPQQTPPPLTPSQPTPPQLAQSQLAQSQLAQSQLAQSQLAQSPPIQPSLETLNGAAAQRNTEGASQRFANTAVTGVNENDAYFARGITRREALALSATLSVPAADQLAALIPASETVVLGGGGFGGGGGGGGGGGRGSGAGRDAGLGGRAGVMDAPLNYGANSSVGAIAAAPSRTYGSSVSDMDLDAIRFSDRLKVTVEQLNNPAMGLEKSNDVRVAEDGTIALPMLDPLPAAGQTTKELEKQIADKYRKANLIADASVRVSKEGPSTTQQVPQPALQMGTAPTTLPGQVMQMTIAATTTQPAPAGVSQDLATAVAAMPPVTQPSLDAEKVDVVVVVQKNLFATAAAAKPEPASQPAEQTPTAK